MQSAFAPPVGLTAAVAVVGALLAAVVPTCLYLYVEPRGRAMWGVLGDAPESRRAPWLVRFTAWLGFVLGELALATLAVPVVCAVLLYLQAKLGVLRPAGAVATGLIAAAALAQALLSLRLFPLGVRLLARDGRLASRAASRARAAALASAVVLGVAAALAWGMGAAPKLVHPWLRAALLWAALRPVMAYAALCLAHALLLARCARPLAGSSPTER